MSRDRARECSVLMKGPGRQNKFHRTVGAGSDKTRARGRHGIPSRWIPYALGPLLLSCWLRAPFIGSEGRIRVSHLVHEAYMSQPSACRGARQEA